MKVHIVSFRSSRLEVFLDKDVLKICSKFTREHPRRSAIYFPVNLLHIFRTLFLRTSLDGCFFSLVAIIVTVVLI